MINRVVLVGRLTKDPELRYTPSGLPVARFTVAVNRVHKNENGERDADFINCIAWRKVAENLANFMTKGCLVGVDGRIQTGSYEGQDGKRVYTTEVVADSVQFLEPGRQNNQQTQQQPPQQQTRQQADQQYNQPAPQWQGQPPNGGQPYQQQPPQQSYQQPQPQWGQHNYQRVDDDPFANSKGPISVSEDDLPFDYRRRKDVMNYGVV